MLLLVAAGRSQEAAFVPLSPFQPKSKVYFSESDSEQPGSAQSTLISGMTYGGLHKIAYRCAMLRIDCMTPCTPAVPWRCEQLTVSVTLLLRMGCLGETVERVALWCSEPT